MSYAIDNDGEKEIIIQDSNSLHVYDSSGNEKSGWPHNEVANLLNLPIVASDVDGNGTKEILTITGNNSNKIISLLSHDGNVIASYPKLDTVSTTIQRYMPVIFDINGDGKKDIVGLSKSTGTLQLIAYNYDGTLISDFAIDIQSGYSTLLTMLAGDTDLDGGIEVILHYPDEKKIISIGTKTKQVEWISSYSVFENLSKDSKGMLIADITGDAYPEIIFLQKPYIFIFNNNGEMINKIKVYSPLDFFYSNNIIVSDVNGDGINEIIFSSDKLYFYNTDGNYAVEPIDFGLFTDVLFPIVGDFNNDGNTEIIVFSNDFFSNDFGVYQALLVNLPYHYVEPENDWPIKYYDLENTRCYNCDKLTF